MLLGCDFIVAPAEAPALGSCLAAGRTIAKDGFSENGMYYSTNEWIEVHSLQRSNDREG